MLVSVVIPVYNSSKTIYQSIESVVKSLERVTEDYEIICVDDGSKDNSLEILKTLSKKNEKILVIHQENAGAAAARNAGLEIAKGEYIAFNDSDDEWLEEHFGILLQILKDHPDIVCVSGNHDCEKQQLPKLRKLEDNLYEISLKNELVKNYYSPPATMFRNKIVAGGIRFKTGMRYAEEGYFFYSVVSKYLCAYTNTKITQSILGKEKFGDGGLSGNLKEMEKGELSNLKYAYNELGIGFFYYVFTVCFSIAKYLRRIIIVKLRHGSKA